ncbi:hypothetical protein V5735_02065 (plasmid) [Haladaptatus sp. SPP-AMP-3]|uniref:hypothetical protein n=1 Tax=Haladaptatus sp. SPP-AMP-3 TaxID=3121295 RepID=UPI003C2BDBD5
MDSDRIDAFTEEVRSGLDGLTAAFESADSFEEVSGEAQKLWDVLDEGEDVLDELDLTDVPEVVELSELPDVIELEDTPDAVDEGDPGELIDVRSLIRAVEFRELWSSTDVRSLWNESDEFTDALENVGVGDSDGRDDGDVAMDGDLKNEVQSELYESKLRNRLQESVAEFREQLMDTRNDLQEVAEENESMGSAGQPSSDNPSAYSTMAGLRSDVGGVARYSTVPKSGWHSSGGGSKRIYGDRFEEEDDG